MSPRNENPRHTNFLAAHEPGFPGVCVCIWDHQRIERRAGRASFVTYGKIVMTKQSRKKVDEKIEQVGENAGSAWVEAALDKVREFAEQANEQPFVIEAVREFAADTLPEPHDGRAWGTVTRRAAKEGIIERIGYVPTRSSNYSPKCLWRALPILKVIEAANRAK